MRVALSAAFVFVIIGAFFFFYGKGSDTNRTIASIDSVSVVEGLKQRIQDAMNNQAAVNYTAERNPNAFACMSSANGDCSGRSGLILLFETPKATDSLSQMQVGQGLALDTLGCTGFPSQDCPIRIETTWTPVCAPGRCENTKSFKLRAKLSFQAGVEATPADWFYEKMLTPSLIISAAVQCQREGGTYTGLTCKRGSAREEAPRTIEASSVNSNVDSGLAPPVPPEPATSVPVAQFACPSTITINGQPWPVDTSIATAQLTVPTSAGCNGQGVDVFDFQCVEKSPAAFDGEGMWTQTRAAIAPSCGTDGNPQEGGPLTI